MSDEKTGTTRRSLFGAASLGLVAAGGLVQRNATAAPSPAATEEEEFANFKYNIESSKGWVGEAGSAKEATVAEFPVSQSIAGVSMRLKPGAIRELHWHALAAEWAYMLEGRCRTTVIAPNGQAEIVDFGPGDTWYFPRGHGHLLRGMGPGECHFLLGFDSGHFSEFGTFSVTDWIAHTPHHVLARNLGLPETAFASFPKKEVYIGPGTVPAAEEQLRFDHTQTNQSAHKFRLDEQTPLVFPGGTERVVQQKDFPIQSTFTAVRMDLNPGALREMHWHPHADEWQYYANGRARVTIFGSHGRIATQEFGPGDICFIKQGYGHFIEQLGTEPTKILILFNSPVYEEISLSTWLAGNPVSVLTDNFGISKEMAEKMPRRNLGIV